MVSPMHIVAILIKDKTVNTILQFVYTKKRSHYQDNSIFGSTKSLIWNYRGVKHIQLKKTSLEVGWTMTDIY